VDPVLAALGGGGNNAISGIMAQKVPQLQQAAAAIRAAQTEVVQAARSQSPQATQQATQKVQAAAAQLDALLQDMNPPQAAAVKKALGI
jgi:hypothetical protein